MDKRFLRNNIGYIIVGLVSAVFIASAFVTIDKTGKSVTQIIADGTIALVLGIVINRIFELQGMMSGDREEKVQNTVNLHGEMVMKISPYIDKLDDWCEAENTKVMRLQRTKILARVGLKYEDCFDENGVAKPYIADVSRLKDKLLRKTERKRIATYQKAVNLNLTLLNAGDLTSEGGKQQDPFYFGRTKVQYETKASLADAIGKVATAVIFGYYGVKLIDEFSVVALIWTSLQVGIFVIMGVIKMYQAYLYVTDEFRGRIVKKIDNLQKFENFIKEQDEREKVTVK